MVVSKKKIRPENFFEYSFESELWKYKGKNSWYFLTLPIELSKLIKKNHAISEEGWGRLRVTCNIGNSVWPTAIWYDSKFKTYLLPIKIEIRRKEGIKEFDVLKCFLRL